MASTVPRSAREPYWFALTDITDLSLAPIIRSYNCKQWHSSLINSSVFGTVHVVTFILVDWCVCTLSTFVSHDFTD